MRDAIADMVRKTRWWLIIIFIGAVGLLFSYQSYSNTLAACERGNVVREVVVEATENAHKNATKGKARYGTAAAKLATAPHANPDGTIRCTEAVTFPIPLP